MNSKNILKILKDNCIVRHNNGKETFQFGLGELSCAAEEIEYKLKSEENSEVENTTISISN